MVGQILRDFGPNGLPFCVSQLSTTSYGSSETWKTAIHRLSGRLEDQTDSLFFVNSLPYNAFRIDPYNIADKIAFQGGRLIQIGSNCTSVLDAIETAASDWALGNTSTVLCLDRFGDVAINSAQSGKVGLNEWRNAAGFMQVGHGGRRVAVMRSASAMAPSLASLLTIDTNDRQDFLAQDKDKLELFRENDLSTEYATIRQALGKTLPADCLFVVTNRATDRTNALMNLMAIRRDRIFSSRASLGHTGGCDIIFNLRRALNYAAGRKCNILISANGIGYRWSAMLLKAQP